MITKTKKMAKLKLRGKDLMKIGYPEGPAIGMAINMMLKHYKRSSKEEVLNILADVLARPDEFKNDMVLGRIVRTMQAKEEQKEKAMAAAMLHADGLLRYVWKALFSAH